MRYCLNLPNAGAAGDARTLAELAACAEDSGWDGVFLEDYIVYQGRQEIPTYDPWVALATIALRTTRIRIGTMVTPLARRRPWKLAREAATIDHLSGGRMVLGVGLGDSADISLTRFGEETNAGRRAAMLDEALEIVAGLWSGRPFRFSGNHYRVDEVTCLPPPLQSPRIPIWVGGAFPNRGPIRRSARWDGACLYKAAVPGSAEDSGEPLAPAEVAALKRAIAAQRTATTPFDIVVHGARRGADAAAERERLRASAAAGATWSQSWIPPRAPAAMRAIISRGPLRID